MQTTLTGVPHRDMHSDKLFKLSAWRYICDVSLVRVFYLQRVTGKLKKSSLKTKQEIHDPSAFSSL